MGSLKRLSYLLSLLQFSTSGLYVFAGLEPWIKIREVQNGGEFDCEKSVNRKLEDLARKPVDEETYMKWLSMWRFVNKQTWKDKERKHQK